MEPCGAERVLLAFFRCWCFRTRRKEKSQKYPLFSVGMMSALFFGSIWVAEVLEGEVHRFFGIRYPGKGRSLAFPAAEPGELSTGVVPDGVLEVGLQGCFISFTLEEFRYESVFEAEALKALPIDSLFVKPFDFFDHAGCESVKKPRPDALAEDFFRGIENENRGVVFGG